MLSERCVQVFEERGPMKSHALKSSVKEKDPVKERENEQEWWWANQVSSLVLPSMKERDSQRQWEQYGSAKRCWNMVKIK